jgi:transposase
MVGLEAKSEVIRLKHEGNSNREVARRTGLNRETVSKYWEEYKGKRHELTEKGVEVDEKLIQEEMTQKPKYDASKRKARKYTEAIETRLKEILESEKRKDTQLGPGHKQKMRNNQIFGIIESEGYDIGRCTINMALARLRAKQKQVFIRQQYEFGDRVEYDFGEVRLILGGELKVCHMAVFASTAGKHRWCKLYTNQKKPVFMDSHVKYFEFVGGSYKEVVYDNMKNVVTKFIGKNEKELNADLIKMSMYYGFKINVTNCFSGNEKGTVEKSVDVLRIELFAVNYTFNTLDDAQTYADSRLRKLNENSLLEEEKKCLLPYMPPLELAQPATAKVDKTSLISVDCVKYSVPEHLVGETVFVKKYHDEIRVFWQNEEVCKHRRETGKDKLVIEIMHYLNTFLRKPGALNNSIALKSVPKLKAIFDTYYAKKPKQFIEILIENKDLPVEEIVKIFKEKTASKAEFKAISVIKPISPVDMNARSSMANYTLLFVKGRSVPAAHVLRAEEAGGVGQ